MRNPQRLYNRICGTKQANDMLIFGGKVYSGVELPDFKAVAVVVADYQRDVYQAMTLGRHWLRGTMALVGSRRDNPTPEAAVQNLEDTLKALEDSPNLSNFVPARRQSFAELCAEAGVSLSKYHG